MYGGHKKEFKFWYQRVNWRVSCIPQGPYWMNQSQDPETNM